MEDKAKNKKELIAEAQVLADKLIEKKSVIETALNDLDAKAAKEGISKEHLDGMAIIEELFTEYEAIELEQAKIFELIKKS
jgi:hypothetical protein